jgi:hypothetical protein
MRSTAHHKRLAQILVRPISTIRQRNQDPACRDCGTRRFVRILDRGVFVMRSIAVSACTSTVVVVIVIIVYLLCTTMARHRDLRTRS